MNKIEFTHPNGFPWTQKTLNFLQGASYDDMKSLVALCGCEASKSYVLNGCTAQNGTISAGWLIIGNEVYPFEGGTGSAIGIQESRENAKYQNGVVKGVYITKKAVINSNGTPISQFIRLTNIKDLLSGVPSATTTAKGVIEIATDSEVYTGSDASRAVTPRSLKNGKYVRDANYVHTDNNFTGGYKSKLDGIGDASETKAGLAERAATAEADAGMDNTRYMTPYLVKRIVDKNKVTIPTATTGRAGISELSTLDEARIGTPNKVITADVLKQEIDRAISMITSNTKVLRSGRFYWGDVNTEAPKTITFESVGTTSYVVQINVKSGYTGSNMHIDNDLSYATSNYKSTSFDLSFREYAGLTQRVTVEYTILKIG